nr:MAG TPA: hypothetical protein [Caudoviricetes sp.]
MGGAPLLGTHFEVIVAFRKNFFFRFFFFLNFIDQYCKY